MAPTTTEIALRKRVVHLSKSATTDNLIWFAFFNILLFRYSLDMVVGDAPRTTVGYIVLALIVAVTILSGHLWLRARQALRNDKNSLEQAEWMYADRTVHKPVPYGRSS